MAPVTPKGKFSENEKLLCYHGPLLYEAKCVKVRKDPTEFKYFVHYQGWNKNWDEWVDETRILKINPENLEKKEKLLANLKENKGKTPKPNKKSKSGTDSANTSRASTPAGSERSFKETPEGASGGGDDNRSTTSSHDDERRPRRKKFRNSNSFNQDDGGDTSGNGEMLSSEPYKPICAIESDTFKIPIPEELRCVLVSDWDLLNHKKSLFTLPAKQTVSGILTEYRKHVEKTGDVENISAVSEVMLGVKDFFNATVGTRLLYKIEKRQYDTVMRQEGKTAADIYGSAHLLRLMVIMASLLSETAIKGETDVQLIENILGQFLNYLETNRGRLFTSKNYFEATEDYLNNVESA